MSAEALRAKADRPQQCLPPTEDGAMQRSGVVCRPLASLARSRRTDPGKSLKEVADDSGIDSRAPDCGRDVDPCNTLVRSGSHVHGHGHRLHRQRAAGRHHHRRSRGERQRLHDGYRRARRVSPAGACRRLHHQSGAERLYYGQSDGAGPHRTDSARRHATVTLCRAGKRHGDGRSAAR